MNATNPSAADRQRVVDEFNARHAVGDEFVVYRGARGIDPIAATLKAPAELSSGHAPVAWFEGVSGCIALTHADPKPKSEGWPTPPPPGTKKSFSPLTLASLTTGIVMIEWGKVAEVAEWLVGHPIWTHEYLALTDELKRLALEQYPALTVDVGDSWEVCRDRVLAHFGETVEVARGGGVRTETPIATAVRALGGGATA